MRSHSGFTLIELLVTVAVAGAAIAMALPGFWGFRAGILKSQTRSTLTADMRFARQLAVTRHAPVVIAFGDGLATSDVTTYTIHSDLDRDRVKDPNEPFLRRTLPSGCELANIALTPRDSVIFDMSGSLFPGTSGGQLVIAGPRGDTDTLNVSAVGMVYRP